VLLVLYHTVGYDPDMGLRLGYDSGYRKLNEILSYVRMPLFTFLSGVVYAMRPAARGEGYRFATGKLKRLMLPFVFVGFITVIVQKLMPGTNSDLEWHNMPLILIWPFGHLWFIAALLFVFLVVGLLDYWGRLEKPLHLALLFLASCVFYQWHEGPVGVLAWNWALYLLPFFVAGVFMKRFGLKWSLCLVVLGLVASWEVSVGILSGVVLLAITPVVPPLATIGLYSYSIYLWHVFGSAGSRILLSSFGVDTIAVLVAAGTAAGVLVPIAFHLAVLRVPYASRALLGVRHRTERPPQPKPKSLNLT
jgi:peptidoglycan/LPS O-acetylase OafA/YrhL